MPGKKKGRGNSSLKKDTDSSKIMSKAKKQRQQELSDSLESFSSSVNRPDPKKLSPVRKGKKLSPIDNTSPQNKVAVDSPEHKQETIAPVITATKQSKESTDKEEHSTESNLSGFQVKTSTRSSTSTTTNLSNMAHSRLDTKLEHLLTHYFTAIGNNHEIRKMFSENDFCDFEEFTSYKKQHLIEMKRKKNNAMVGFDDQKITLIHDVVLYYHFLQGETTTKALAEEPTNWVREDFKDWIEQGCYPIIASYNVSLAGTTTIITAPTGPVVVPNIKKVEDSWMS